MKAVVTETDRQRAKYYHGGPADIWPGRILPPSKTGAASNADFGAERVCRRGRVYVTTSLEVAMLFAAFAPSDKAAVYEVRPVGELEADPDCDVQGISFSCEAAEIVREIPLGRHVRRAIVEDGVP